MIFLPPVHISSKKSIPIYHTKFVLGNYLYFIYDKDAETNWVMKRLDLKTFNHTRLDVQFEEGFQARIPEYQSEGVIVKRGKAYSWNCKDNFLLEGRIDADCFHWRKINASGPMPPFRASFSIDDGTDNYLSFIAEGTGDETLSMYRLDLTTFVWSRQGMVIGQQIIVNELRSFPPWRYPWPDFLVGQQVHFIRFRGRSHLILDIATLEWTDDESILPNYIYFSDGLQMHMIGKDDSTPQKRKSNKSIISRYDAGEMEWNQISQIANVHLIDQSRYDCFNVGTRIVIVEGFRHGRQWVETILLLELEPTLFDLAATAIWRDRHRSKLARSLLPEQILEELIARRVLAKEEEELEAENEKRRQPKRLRASSTQQKKTPSKKAK